MRIFKTLWFQRFIHKEGISDKSLTDLVSDMEKGNINADLGGGVYKERLGRLHEGKSGGFRILLCYKAHELAFFAYGFPKSQKENISIQEKDDLKKLSHILLHLSASELDEKVASGAFLEISAH